MSPNYSLSKRPERAPGVVILEVNLPTVCRQISLSDADIISPTPDGAVRVGCTSCLR
jgi:hypothetical protein